MISVLIASRLEEKEPGKLFVERAIETIRAQDVECQIIVGLDPGKTAKLDAEVVAGPRANLCAAINAAAERIEGDYVAMIEDDDEWCVNHLAASLAVLQEYDFVSGNQLVVDESDNVLCINDFATPDSWVMKRAVWDAVGGFSEEYPVHTDHDWLGRLCQAGISRAHLVEATAPTDIAAAEMIRPWLANIMRVGVKIARHSSPYPLVNRLYRDASWMGQIRAGGSARAVSDLCTKMIIEKHGCFPW